MFWLPSKHNEKTEKLLKDTQETYKEKETKFKEEAHARLEDRLRIYDARIQEITKNQSPTKTIS